MGKNKNVCINTSVELSKDAKEKAKTEKEWSSTRTVDFIHSKWSKMLWTLTELNHAQLITVIDFAKGILNRNLLWGEWDEVTIALEKARSQGNAKEIKHLESRLESIKKVFPSGLDEIVARESQIDDLIDRLTEMDKYLPLIVEDAKREEINARKTA